MNGYKLDPNGEEQVIDRFSIGALKGIEMGFDVVRMNSNGEFSALKFHDKVTFECIGIMENPDPELSDMPEFMITVDR